ncbi:hypothetical protein [Nocardia sp. CA-120079]|uniref:hypothetical protein n=1 Tax=Nocardia sp. CA-120079 TaxID=3239974 RepID=UPI003D97051E
MRPTPERTDVKSPDVERIGRLLAEWLPDRKAITVVEYIERANQVVCFLGGCIIAIRAAFWFGRCQHNEMHLVYMGEKRVLSLYEGFEPAIVVQV